MLQQTLNQKLLQKLSPQQIQLMKLLQVPTATLEQRIKEELEANPALEETDGDYSDNDTDTDYSTDNNHDTDDTFEPEYTDLKEADGPDTPVEREDYDEFAEGGTRTEDDVMDDYIRDYVEDDVAAYKLSGDYAAEEEDKSSPLSLENSFHEFLYEQLGLVRLDDRREKIARQIIGSIDDDGYLRRQIDAIVDDLAFSQGITTDETEVATVLTIVHRFDPAGVAARDLQECLVLQLRRKIEQPADYDPTTLADLRTAQLLLEQRFEEFTKKHYERLQRSLGLSEVALRRAIQEILRLNPKPASAYTGASIGTQSGAMQYIVPDFIVTNNGGDLDLALNSRNAPDLRVSAQYREMLRAYSERAKKDKREKEAVMFIKQKIDSAKWFIDAIIQRQQTMFSTMFAILEQQREYFLTGDERHLKPMILKDVAEATGLDISTVSRVASSKYVQTEFGTKQLKSFFSEAIITEEGEEVSTLEVKSLINELIAEESKRNPFSDEKLMDMLLEHGYSIARRTVAKYREQLNIPVARLRKEL